MEASEERDEARRRSEYRHRSASVVMQIHHAVSETTFVTQRQRKACARRKGTRAATYDDRRDEELTHVHEASLERFARQVRATDADVVTGAGLHRANGSGIERPLES